MFLVIMTFVLWGMQAVSGAWLFIAFPQIGWKVPAGILPVLLTAFILFGMSYTRTHDGAFSGALYYAAYTWFGLAFLAFCISAACVLLQWVLQLFHLNARAWLGPVSLGVMAVVFALALWGGFSNPAVKRVKVTVPGAPKMKIALISDSHLGMGVSFNRFEKALQKIEAERPDVIFLLGDIFEYGPNLKKYAQRLKQTEPPQGIYGVFGNHEYYVGYEQSKALFKETGAVLLENQTAVLPNGVQVAGIKDARTARVTAQDVQTLLAQADAQKPLVFLSHTPVYAEEAANAGADLMFSGHTHNGQIFPFKYLVRLQFPRVYGLYDVDGMQFYITSGMFYWGIPLRFLAPFEIPLIEVN
uniref:Putative metallophosphoesterase n=1 Tax=uncultured Elusimicrobia bacterium TaxID=699876 RepID=A0A650ENI2_9BACT|nr:putative metallophosphoesterase [uncultured Elusimicrobia bacterium]